MSTKPSRFVIPTGTDLTQDADVLPALRGRNFLSRKSPRWMNENQETMAGREFRRRQWSYPKWNFELSHEFINNESSASDLEKLMAFYNSKSGSWKEFLYLDDEDKVATLEPVGVGNGSATLFQLTRTTTQGGITFTEPVRAFFGTPQVFVNSILTSVTVGEYGKVTFASAPANGAVITWSGTFFFVCRFDENELELAQMMSRLWENESLTFTSIKI